MRLGARTRRSACDLFCAAKSPLTGALCRVRKYWSLTYPRGQGVAGNGVAKITKSSSEYLASQASIAQHHIACRVVIRSNPPVTQLHCPTIRILLPLGDGRKPQSHRENGTLLGQFSRGARAAAIYVSPSYRTVHVLRNIALVTSIHGMGCEMRRLNNFIVRSH